MTGQRAGNQEPAGGERHADTESAGRADRSRRADSADGMPLRARRRRRLRARTAAVAGLCVIALTAASVPALNMFVYSPARAVDAYLSAIAAGEAGRALSHLVTGEIDDASALVDDALRGAPSLPERTAVTHAHTEGRSAVVTAEYDLDGSTRSQDFHLVRDDGTWGLYHQWRIQVDELPRLQLQVEGASTVQLNSAEIELRREGLPVLFPAEYNVSFAQEYFRSPATGVTALEPGQALEAALSPEPTEKLRTEVEEQVHRHLDECAESETLLPAGCTFGFPSSHEILGDVTWEIEQYPNVALESERSRLVVAPASAVARVEGRSRDIVTAVESDFSEVVRFTFTAAVRVEDGNPSLVPLDPGLQGGPETS